MVGLVTDRVGRGLAQLPTRDENAEVTRLPPGRLPARTERTTDGGSAATEVVPGSALRIRYVNHRAGARVCSIAAILQSTEN